MADVIRPTQPNMPSPLVSPRPEDKRQQQRKPQQQDTEENNDMPAPDDENKGHQVDEYV